MDLSPDCGKKEGLKKLGRQQDRLAALSLTLGGQIGSGEVGPPVCVLMEGWDASGKGGAIKRVEKLIRKKVWKRACQEIRNFESGLSDEGMVVVKMWLHISPEEQRRGYSIEMSRTAGPPLSPEGPSCRPGRASVSRSCPVPSPAPLPDRPPSPCPPSAPCPVRSA